MGAIQLENLKNTRDLGGIKTKDGRKIKEKCLIKSGTLYPATESDLKVLMEDYNVKMVIDLRTKRERDAMPNPCMKGVSEIWNPLFMEHIQGLDEFEPMDVKTLVKKDCFDAEAYMARLYQKVVNNQMIQKQMKQFFSMISNHRGGAILWHCSAGKDRTGVITALLLSALGVSKEEIIKDYEASSESSEDVVEVIIDKLFPGNEMGCLKYREAAKQLFGMKSCYIDCFLDAIEKDYVSVENYLQKALEIHVDNIVRLKTLYLDER